MKIRFFVGISVILLLIILTFTSPAQAVGPTDFAGHNFGEEHFAIEVDLVGGGTSVFDPDPENPDLIRDLSDPEATTGDSNPLEDLQFYLAYMNMSGIETAFSALEKFEHMLTFKDFIADDTYDDIWDAGALLPSLRDALEAPLSHVNATAPFQQLVQHYTTSEESGFKDVFVTNNFMALIAYSTGTGSDPNLMDENDDLYLGYTLAIQNLGDIFNEALVLNGHSEVQIEHFNFESMFKITSKSFEFGIKYTDLFVLWQKIDVEPKTIDVFAGEGDHGEYLKDETGGIVFGGEIVAASLLDYISFDYVFETSVFRGVNECVEGTVTTHYDIGETNLLITPDDAAYIADHADNWTHDPFAGEFSYTLTIPDAIANFNFDPLGLPDIPNSVTVDLPELAFYVDDDAKTRLKMHNGFGLTIATATTSFGVDVVDPDYKTEGDDINLNMGGKKYFFTEFTDKKTYKLLGLENLWGINPNTDRPVEVIPFDPTGWGVANFGIAKAYFAVEFGLAYGFTKFMVEELDEFMSMSPDAAAYVSVDLLYFTFTEFPKWYGGEIIHDPTYSAVAAWVPEETSTMHTSTFPRTKTTSRSTSGFSLTLLLLIILPVLTFLRRRK